MSKRNIGDEILEGIQEIQQYNRGEVSLRTTELTPPSPPQEIENHVELQLLSPGHRDELFRLMDDNREHLREWLPWVDAIQSLDNTESFINATVSQYESGKGPQYAVFHQSDMCGVCGFHPFDVTNRVGGIGYWLGSAYSGKGIMASAVQAVVEIGFRDYELNRVEIACAMENTRSQAIPERLGFKFEGVLREREYLYGRYVDHAVYSMLASEFALKMTTMESRLKQ